MARRSLCLWAVGIAIAAFAWRPLCARAQDPESERELGRRFAFQAGAELALLRDPPLALYLQRVGQKIVDSLGPQPFEYHFFVVRDPNVNAFAVPGGYVYVNSGLLLRVDDDDQLAGVLAHEIAHVHAHHLVRQQEETKWLSYARLAGLLASFVHPAIGAATIGASTTAQLQYTREFEQEADYLGAGYMQQAGYDPRGMLDFLQKLWNEQRLASSPAPPYLMTHPLTEERLTHLEAVLRTTQWSAHPQRQPSPDLARVRLLARVRTESASDVLSSYQDEVTKRPEDATARCELGSVLFEYGSYEAARVTLEQARAMGCANADRDLGRALYHLGRLDGARQSLARAVEIDPSDAVARYEYGNVLQELGDLTAAIAAYQQALALYPDLADAQRQLGLMEGRGGKEGEGYYHLGKAYLLNGDYAQALHQLEQAEKLLPVGDELSDVKEVLPQLRDYASHKG